MRGLRPGQEKEVTDYEARQKEGAEGGDEGSRAGRPQLRQTRRRISGGRGRPKRVRPRVAQARDWGGLWAGNTAAYVTGQAPRQPRHSPSSTSHPGPPGVRSRQIRHCTQSLLTSGRLLLKLNH